jgi:hypothetical protein
MERGFAWAVQTVTAIGDFTFFLPSSCRLASWEHQPQTQTDILPCCSDSSKSVSPAASPTPLAFLRRLLRHHAPSIRNPLSFLWWLLPNSSHYFFQMLSDVRDVLTFFFEVLGIGLRPPFFLFGNRVSSCSPRWHGLPILLPQPLECWITGICFHSGS